MSRTKILELGAVTPELLRDPGWRAALHIITSTTFRRNDGRLWAHVDLDRQSLYFDRVLANGTWSSTEALMLRAAWSLFNQNCAVNLYELAHRLDNDQLVTILQAFACAASPGYVPKVGLLHERSRQ